MGKKNITFNDIAKYTGFSKTTVSRYFNNPDSLTLENQQIISDALDKLTIRRIKLPGSWQTGKPNLSVLSFQTFIYITIPKC